MKILTFIISIVFLYTLSSAQPTTTWSSSQIYQAIKKLNVLGSVLYIAAHPDDENTRLIAYMANERLYRTGYLSLTRGDGGQNLIGDEQGVELGLIRTQELLAARRIDGGEQFFSSAYDFGFSKTPEETFTKWDKQKILSDVVWMIRKFRPDVIITRFPTTGEGGHGHHTASAILANEAFIAAADTNMFKEQLKYVQPWQAKRILWNTFNFGNTNTIDSTQYKLDVGGFNAQMGKGYGEIAALSRSQHKSQGFGSAAIRGESFEYFKTTGGINPKMDIMDDVDVSWNRVGAIGMEVQKMIGEIESSYNINAPEKSVTGLVGLYDKMQGLPESYWKQKKSDEVQQLIAQCSGLYLDAITGQPYAVQTDSLKISATINSRLAKDIVLEKILIDDETIVIHEKLSKNKNFNFSKTILVSSDKEITQPYWLKERMDEGHFHIEDQRMIGMADVQPAYVVRFVISIAGTNLNFNIPVKHRFTDPVKGEVYQPLCVVPAATVTTSPAIVLFNKNKKQNKLAHVSFNANKPMSGALTVGLNGNDFHAKMSENDPFEKVSSRTYNFSINNSQLQNEKSDLFGYANRMNSTDSTGYYLALRSIEYDHIPSIKYFYPDVIRVLNTDLETRGKTIGYIPGAGDKVPEALEQMGYTVTLLNQSNLANTDLSGFDAIITGVRAYNVNEWLNTFYDKLMSYVRNGGNLIVQYNTSTSVGPVKAKIGPYDFSISRSRITDETAEVNLIDPANSVFNFPNKITGQDFEGWIQERSIYHAANWDKNLKPLLSMADPGEAANNGALLVAKYGKGYFTYTGLVFFRELPAAVPGAYRLLANIIALNKQINNK